MNARPPAFKASEDGGPPEGATPPLSIDASIIRDVKVSLKVRLGEVEMTVEELMALKTGSVLKLDRMLAELVDLRLNDALVARGEIVSVDDHFGIRLVEIGRLG